MIHLKQLVTKNTTSHTMVHLHIHYIFMHKVFTHTRTHVHTPKCVLAKKTT